MSRRLYTISKASREWIARVIAAAPDGTRLELKAEKRSLPQNDLMWSRLTEVADQLAWHGQKLRPGDWKLIFLDALKREVRAVPAIDGRGWVNIGRSSSDLSKSEMTDLLELIAAFGAQHGVIFRDQAEAA